MLDICSAGPGHTVEIVAHVSSAIFFLGCTGYPTSSNSMLHARVPGVLAPFFQKCGPGLLACKLLAYSDLSTLDRFFCTPAPNSDMAKDPTYSTAMSSSAYVTCQKRVQVTNK